MKPGYKQTEVGVIPEEWDSRRIGDDIDLLTGFPFPSSGYADAGIRLLRGSNVKRGQTDWTDAITQYWPALTPDITRYELKDGDLVIAMDGSLVGRSFARLSGEDLPAVLLQRVARIRSKKLDVSYLTAFVGSERFINYADSVKTVTAIPHISPADIRNFAIPVPPNIGEQRAIAGVLSDVDALLRALDRLIAKKRDLKQAAMQQLLTGQTRLPGFHGEWEVKTLSDICTMKSGKGITSANIDGFSKYPCYGGNGLRGFTTRFTHEGSYALIGRQGALCGNVLGVEGTFFASEHAIVVTALPQTIQSFI
jgi:type I restriction enzyme S subunit